MAIQRWEVRGFLEPLTNILHDLSPMQIVEIFNGGNQWDPVLRQVFIQEVLG